MRPWFWNLILLNLTLRPLLATCNLQLAWGKVLAAAGSGFQGHKRNNMCGEIYCTFWCASWTTWSSSSKRCDRRLNCVALACRCNLSLFSDIGPLEAVVENKTEQKSAAKRRQRLLKAPQQPPSYDARFPTVRAYSWWTWTLYPENRGNLRKNNASV